MAATRITLFRGRRKLSCVLRTEDVWFIGRLATYRYYNMDQVVGQALATFRRLDERRKKAGKPRVKQTVWTEAAE